MTRTKLLPMNDSATFCRSHRKQPAQPPIPPLQTIPITIRVDTHSKHRHNSQYNTYVCMYVDVNNFRS